MLKKRRFQSFSESLMWIKRTMISYLFNKLIRFMPIMNFNNFIDVGFVVSLLQNPKSKILHIDAKQLAYHTVANGFFLIVFFAKSLFKKIYIPIPLSKTIFEPIFFSFHISIDWQTSSTIVKLANCILG